MIMECGSGCQPLTDDAWTGTGRDGTHAFGLAAAVELARALHRLPPRLVLIGIEAGGLEHGEPLSAPVRAAVQQAVEATRGIVSEAGAPSNHRTRGTGTAATLVAREVDA